MSLPLFIIAIIVIITDARVGFCLRLFLFVVMIEGAMLARLFNASFVYRRYNATVAKLMCPDV